MKLENMNVMLDLETLGKGSHACIIAIGAVTFNREGVLSTFYQRVDEESSVAAGLKIDASTVMWWMKQSDAARNALTAEKGMSLVHALARFTMWCPEETAVWGNGAAFDNVILANAYDAVNLRKPWPYWGDRCYRTVKALNPDVAMPVFTGTKHNALDDARNQAEHLIKIASA